MAKLILEFDDEAGTGGVTAEDFDAGDAAVMAFMAVNFLATHLGVSLEAALEFLTRHARDYRGAVVGRCVVDPSAVEDALRRRRERDGEGAADGPD